MTPEANGTADPPKRRPLSEREKLRRRLARRPVYVTATERARRERLAERHLEALAELSRLFWRIPSPHLNHESHQ